MICFISNASILPHAALSGNFSPTEILNVLTCKIGPQSGIIMDHINHPPTNLPNHQCLIFFKSNPNPTLIQPRPNPDPTPTQLQFECGTSNPACLSFFFFFYVHCFSPTSGGHRNLLGHHILIQLQGELKKLIPLKCVHL